MYTDKINILLIAGDPDERLFLKNAFKGLKTPYSLTICEDSRQLAEYLEHIKEPPHLIFMDVALPGQSGIECLRHIRKNSKFNDCTIAVYSDLPAGKETKDLFVSGANIYIGKPGSRGQLDKIIREVVSINWQYIIDGLDRERFIMKY